MLAGLLDIFRGGPNLIVKLRLNFINSLVGVEAISNVCKVLLHQVDVLVVVVHVDAWIANYDYSVAVEALCYFFALVEGCLGRAAIFYCAQI